MDRLSPERRSRLMSRIRGKHTTPEMAVRRVLHKLGYRFRLHDGGLPGEPDIVFRSRKKALMVHGCFWHRHLGCSKASLPKSNVKYWEEKFRRNVQRDELAVRQLRELGWEVETIWECETKSLPELKEKLQRFLG